MSPSQVTVLLPEDSESWSAFADRIAAAEGDVLAVLSGREEDLVEQAEIRSMFFKQCKKHAKKLRLATKHPLIASEARAQGIRVLERTKQIKHLLEGHPLLNEVMQVFSPHLWKQQLTSRLQRMGLLSLPRLRIFSLVGLSLLLFFFVVFRLLPSAEVRLVPRQEPVSQTMNLFLVLSGSSIPQPARIQSLPLMTLDVETSKTVEFTDISKEFIGTPAKGEITVKNQASEDYSFRKGTRFTNQAGMVFRSTESLIVPTGAQGTVKVTADPLDLYGQVIGERGNVPVGVKWDLPGLTEGERAVIFGENKKPFTGGTTAYKTILKQGDIDTAQKSLQDQLVASARQQTEKILANAGETSRTDLKLLDFPDLTKIAFTGFVLPVDKLGQVVQSVPVQGGVRFGMYAYDRDAILALLSKELRTHVREGKRLITSSISKDHLDVRVIDYADDLSWVKLTVELLGTEEYVLDPLSPNGAIFGKRLREKIVGQPYDAALRIVKNMPEVDKVTISLWPPWSRTMPGIPSHISVLPD